MLKILLVSPARDHLSVFAAALSSEAGVAVGWAESGKEALEIAGAERPHLVVIDDALADTAALDLVAQLLTLDAMMNTAVVSEVPPEEFHAASEGLGVMAQLPPHPGRENAAETLASLKRLTGF
jgi:DNA-binding response OmpR family regulator